MKMLGMGAPSMPAPQKPTDMPDPDAIKAAKKKAVVEQMARSGGRDSTILSSREGL